MCGGILCFSISGAAGTQLINAIVAASLLAAAAYGMAKGLKGHVTCRICLTLFGKTNKNRNVTVRRHGLLNDVQE